MRDPVFGPRLHHWSQTDLANKWRYLKKFYKHDESIQSKYTTQPYQSKKPIKLPKQTTEQQISQTYDEVNDQHNNDYPASATTSSAYQSSSQPWTKEEVIEQMKLRF